MSAPFHQFSIDEVQASGKAGVAVVPVRIATWLEFTGLNEARIRKFISDAINEKLIAIRDEQ